MNKRLSHGEQMDVMFDGFLKMKDIAENGLETNYELIAKVEKLEDLNGQLIDFIEANGLNFEPKIIN